MERIAVVGLGYAGLPLATAIARAFPGTVGFDTDLRKVENLRAGQDPCGELSSETLRAAKLDVTGDPAALKDRTFFIVCVPTPVDAQNRPDLRPLLAASETVGKALAPGAAVVYESTVYPGLTEEICGPALERASGRKRGADFKLGYSPERINPGDKEHTLDKVVKVVAGEDAQTLERVAAVYASIVSAGIYRAPSIKVAEAAKVIENTQRDLNIAFMNELALICDRLGIRTREVLEAAATKWNFLPFAPGLVGGHCIGVDPYYLTSKAQELGYHPEVILAGRRINDGMGIYVARKTVKLLMQRGVAPGSARVAVLGVTFKENVSDVRNSRVKDLAAELRAFGVRPLLHDPVAEAAEAGREGFELGPWEDVKDLDALILAAPHRIFTERPAAEFAARLKPGGLFVDVKSVYRPADFEPSFGYWSL